jgi:taurine dioxygenase
MLTTRPLSSAGGVEVLDLDVTADLSDAVKEELIGLFDRHGVLLFRGQAIDKPSVIEVTKVFGTPELTALGDLHDGEYPEVGVFSTHGVRGEVVPEPDEIAGQVDWHTDSCFVTTPNRGGVMYSVEIPPEDGMTGFIDMKRLYDDLDEGMKARIEDLSVILSWAFGQETVARNPTFRKNGQGADPNRFPDLVGKLVRPHPKYGAKCLHLPPLWSAGFVEMEGEAGLALRDELLEHVRRPDYAYWHSYKPGDVVVWDNWRMMHAASGTKGIYRRTMHRTIIHGGLQLSAPLSEVLEQRKAAGVAA